MASHVPAPLPPGPGGSRRGRQSSSSSDDSSVIPSPSSLPEVGALALCAVAAQTQAHRHTHARRRPLPTPSPLRRIEDPVQDHIMPSRRQLAKRGGGGERGMMPPPAPRPRKKGQAPTVVDEDSFVEAMGEIIERDFFPELPRLQRQVKWLEALESRRLQSLTEVRRVVQSEMRHEEEDERRGVKRGGGGTRNEGGGGGATPMSSWSDDDRHARGEGGGGGEGGGADQEEEERGTIPLSLDQFLARFQSEDDASFDVLADKMREAHRRKYWWVYEHPAIEAGREKLYLLPNGEFMSEEEHRKHVAASNAKPRLGDDRPNAPETWPYRPQNAFMFLPSLEESVKIHDRGKDGATQPDVALMLENGDGKRKMLTAGGGCGGGGSSNTRTGHAAKAPKQVVHSNTRFSGAFGKGSSSSALMASPLERLTSTASSTLSTDTTASVTSASNNQGFVAMTPLLIPGAQGEVPMMTWGAIESTPMRVSEPFDDPQEDEEMRRKKGREEEEETMEEVGPKKGFSIQDIRHREKVANRLDADVKRKRKRHGGEGGGGGGGGGSSRRHTHTHTQPSPYEAGGGRKRGLASLTPAAQSLAAKIAVSGDGGGGGSRRDDVFGGGMSMSTYAGSSMRRPTPGGGAGRRVGGCGGITPILSPVVGRTGGHKRVKAGEAATTTTSRTSSSSSTSGGSEGVQKKKSGSGTGSGGGGETGGLTGNLLNI